MTSATREVEQATGHVIPDGPFARLGRWSAAPSALDHRGVDRGVPGDGAAGLQLSGRLSQGGFQIAGSTSQNAINVVSSKFTNQFPASMTLVLTSPTLAPSDPAFEAVIAKTAAAVKQAGGPVIGGIVTPAENPRWPIPAARTAR